MRWKIPPGLWRALTELGQSLPCRAMQCLQNSLIELIRRASAEIPDDVQHAILDSLHRN